ncbi:MAG TPA: TetR family transcriptional regulator [Mycobacteriales bacterium]|nr:TetR family transcriptional regulator [Mycobacteriales bacterium]
MTTAARRGDRDPLSRDAVVETALALVTAQGVDALTMRRLATELGTAVTAIYWHVGNRDALLDLLVERVLADIGTVRPVGRTPQLRVASLVRKLRTALLDHPHLIGLVHERGAAARMFQPVQAALATELAAIGQHGATAALTIQALQQHVLASLVLERALARAPGPDPEAIEDWQGPDDAVLVARLAEQPDHERLFEVGLDALIAHLLA